MIWDNTIKFETRVDLIDHNAASDDLESLIYEKFGSLDEEVFDAVWTAFSNDMAMRFEVDIETGKVRCLGIADQNFDKPIPFDTSNRVPAGTENFHKIPEQSEKTVEYHVFAGDVKMNIEPLRNINDVSQFFKDAAEDEPDGVSLYRVKPINAKGESEGEDLLANMFVAIKE